MYAFMTSLSIGNKYRVAPVSRSAPIAPICPVNLGKSSFGKKKIHPVVSNKESFLEEKLTADGKQYEDVSHRAALQQAETAVKKILEENIPGIKIWMTGSVPAGADILGSDLDMSINVKGLKGKDLEKLHECRKMLLDGPICGEDLNPKVLKAKVPVMQLFHRETKVHIDVTIDNDAAKRNTQLLVWYGQIDGRFQVLCRAVKDWAKSVGVQRAKDGRLNSFSLCLMVTHYLQVCGILPNLQELFPELNGDFEVENDDYQKRNLSKELEQRGHRFGDNESSVGVLFARFLKYYAEFNFSRHWISVRHGKLMKKKWDAMGEPMNGMPQSSERIVIADPFLDPAWNCGGSVWASEVCKRIQLEFQLSLKRLSKERTLFGCHLKSVTRRKVEAGAKERDLQFEFWRTEWLAERKEKEIESGKVKSDEWQTPPETWATEWEEIPHQGYKDPKLFWDLKEKEKIVPPWPTPLRCLGY